MKNIRKYFGTDGIRGKANSNKMNASLALNIGMATAEYFTRGNHKHFVLIGKDTRLSNYTICLLYTSPSPRDRSSSRMPSSA